MEKSKMRYPEAEIKAAGVMFENLKDVAGDDQEFLSDMVEGETNLFEITEKLLRAIAGDEARIKGIAEMVKIHNDRRDRLKERTQCIKAILQTGLEMSGLNKIESDLATIGLRAVPDKLIITEESMIPSDFFEPQPPKLDRRALLVGLKNHPANTTPLQGATLSNGGQTIAVRWK